MTNTALQSPPPDLADATAEQLAQAWLDGLAGVVASRSIADGRELFAETATWRDFMALDWDFSHRIGRDALVPWLIDLMATAHASQFAVNHEVPPEFGEGGVDAFFDFRTTDRVVRGYVHLVVEDGRPVAERVQSQLLALADHPERIGHRRPDGKVYDVVMDRTRWSDDRRRQAAFEDEEPAVVVLGAGHNGLAIAARLGALSVPTLVIEREARVGDTWRKRYASLALHSTVWGDHLPYLPLPPTWTAHTPKDKWADFLESYATLLDLNVWTGTTFREASYDDEAQVWTVRVERADGTTAELHPRHFVVAGGMFGDPKIPAVPGLESFQGRAVHSDSFQDAAEYSGRNVLVVGAGVSGHELAQDLYEHGADVTMLQRSSTYVVSFEAYHKLWNSLFTEDATRPPEFLDQIAYALPFEGPGDDLQRELVKLGAEHDRELLDRLAAAGFKLQWGPDGTGIIGAHMSGVDSYQIDIGASSLIADGRVHLKQGVEISRVQGDTVVFSDGSELAVDLIVFATGYHQFWGHIAPMLGDAAAKVDHAYGRAADGEYLNTWRRSAQPGLWFGTGFIRIARYYSAFMAMLIKAIEVGIEPIDPDRPGRV
ncbi:MAG: NAD(P)/FAD-dependent oxidoreductase [Nocardioidaceae bacterium]